MAKVFREYGEAIAYAESQANSLKHSHGIENGREYGRSIYKVFMIPNDPAKRFGHEMFCEAVDPCHT
jgi:hypothetical protein